LVGGGDDEEAEEEEEEGNAVLGVFLDILEFLPFLYFVSILRNGGQ
jgi:hypothetical protein